MKKIMCGYLALAALGAPASGHAQPTKFNLVCKGELQTIAPAALIDEKKEYSTVLHVDLDAMRWCEADCTSSHEIAELTPTTITFQQRSIDTPRELDKLRHTVSRVTGQHSITAENGTGAMRMAMFWRGQCEPGEFTGFPKPVTKF